MCISCGCGAAEKRHGDDRNITLGDLQSAAVAAGISLVQLSMNLQRGLSHHIGLAGELAREVESLNEPLPSGQFPGRLETTPYTE